MGEVGFPREGGPVGVMLSDHEEGRAYVKSLSAALERVRSGETAALKDPARAAAGYSSLLSAHIGKGAQHPLSDGHGRHPRGSLEDPENEFDRIESERMGPKRRAGYVALVDRLLIAYPAPELAQPSGGMCH